MNNLIKVNYQIEENEVSFYTTWDGIAKTVGYNNYQGMENVAEKGENGAYMVHINGNVVHENNLVRQYKYLVWNQTKGVILAKNRETAKRILRNLSK